MAKSQNRTCTYDRGNILFDSEPVGGSTNIPCQSRTQSLEAQSTSEALGANPQVRLGTYDRGDVHITLPSDRPSGAALDGGGNDQA
jgi:hypothetical protein